MRRAARLILTALLITMVIFASAAVPVHAQATALYFPRTGHHVTDEHGFLSFWRSHDGPRTLGFPVTEALMIEGVGPAQYFEKGRLERVTAADGAPIVRTGAVAAEYVAALYRTFPPRPDRPPVEGELLFRETGYSVREPFLGFWQAAGGVDFFGMPISEPLWEQTVAGYRQVQYFERARLERVPTNTGTDDIQVGDLGRALAELRGLNIAPVPNRGFETFGPPASAAPDIAPLRSAPATPTLRPAAPPTAQPASPPRATVAPRSLAPPPANRAPAVTTRAAKRIVVNLSKQWLYAYEDDRLVFDAPVATGRDGMNTPTGTFQIYAKLPMQTMDGVTDGKYWVVPNVPHVMYFYGGVALHGTYWHNLFGTGARPSHGCVNLPVKSAAWLYEWAPIGTPVHVTYR
ncbi:MAG: L,D-transpeptidase [Roseiflexus sp.]|nr:L,D-transpeptidase [Roseiflexus sp.]MDW8233203.1 L,D-transpeptidase [Roseiflexaceae bacterium]